MPSNSLTVIFSFRLKFFNIEPFLPAVFPQFYLSKKSMDSRKQKQENSTNQIKVRAKIQ